MIYKKKDFILEIENLFIIILISFFISVRIKLFLTSYFVCYLFIVFHELAHIIFATIYGKKIKRIRLSLAGVCVTFNNEELKIAKKIIVYLAGPMSNIALAIIFKNIDFIYEVNVFLAFLNLMPIYPLDGYNVINCFLDLCNKSSYIYFIERVFIFFLLFFSIFILFFNLNPSLIIFTTYVILLKNSSKKYGKM